MCIYRKNKQTHTWYVLFTGQIISDEKSNPAMIQVSSESRLNYIRNKQDEDANCSKDNEFHSSIILAGNLASQQYTSLSDSCIITKKNCNTVGNNDQRLSRDTSNTLDETSYLSIKPDLNKCMNLFRNEHLIEEHDSLAEQLNTTLSETTSSENINISHLNRSMIVGQWNINNKLSRSMSADSLQNILLNPEFTKRSKSNTMLDRILKRDTNYNIKADQLSSSSKIAMNIDRNERVEPFISSFTSLSLKSPVLSSRKKDSYSVEDHHMLDSISSEKSSKDDLTPSELRTLLYLLADPKSLKEITRQQELLRCLSTKYYDSPKGFTKRLLTIIEESVINDDSLQYPEVSLHRFNEEVQKMSKFIEDETVPEWPQSPGMSTSIYTKRKNQELKSNLSRKCLTFRTPDKNLTPVSSRCNIKSPEKICRPMSKNASYTTKNLHDSTNTFENLEAYCEKLYPNEYIAFSAKEKNQLQSPLQNMDNIRRVCESQMTSLEDSFNVYEEIRKARTCISDSADQHKTPEMQDLQHRLMSYEKYDRADSKKVSDTFKQPTKPSKHDEVSELDDFEHTLMYKIAKHRQKCLDTARTMEIDPNLDLVEEACSNIVISESSPAINDDKFMKILMCVKKYQDYLKEHKSLLNLLHRTRSSSPRNTKDARPKKKNENLDIRSPSVLLGNKPTLRIPKFSPKKKSTSPSAKYSPTNKTIVSKPQLFTTPGKTYSVNKNYRSKRTYFPNLLPGQNKQDEPNINPHAKKIYRQIGNYDHVISPVRMYIKGKESLKIKPTTNEKLLISERKKTTRSPSPKLEFRLSSERLKEVSKNGINKDKYNLQDLQYIKNLSRFALMIIFRIQKCMAHSCLINMVCGNLFVPKI